MIKKRLIARKIRTRKRYEGGKEGKKGIFCLTHTMKKEKSKNGTLSTFASCMHVTLEHTVIFSSGQIRYQQTSLSDTNTSITLII